MKLNKLLIAAASALTAQAAFAGVYPQCPFDITADGKQIIVNAMMPSRIPPSLTLIVNWQGLLENAQ